MPDNDDKASAEPDVAADSRSSSGGRGRVDRERAVRLVGAAAVEMRRALADATREGGLSRKARRELYELVPPPTLAEGIRDGTLRAAKPKTGDASVLVKNVKDGTIAGKADLQRVKPTPAELIGPVAWEAMALATQQHYLAEISEKLDGIQHGVDEVLAQLNDDRVGSLNHWSEVAASAQAAARRDGRLSETRLAEVREGALRTKELWHQITTTARRQLEQYASGKSSPTEVEGTFQILAHAVHVLTQCSDALTTLPYRDADQLEATLSAEQDRMHPVLPEFVKLCGDLLEASEAWERRHADYEAVRPTNRVARLVRIPGVLLNRDEGKFGVEVTVRPKQKPLEAAQAENLRAVIDSSTHTAHLLLAEVVEDGSVLVGCVMPGRSSLADGPTD